MYESIHFLPSLVSLKVNLKSLAQKEVCCTGKFLWHLCKLDIVSLQGTEYWIEMTARSSALVGPANHNCSPSFYIPWHEAGRCIKRDRVSWSPQDPFTHESICFAFLIDAVYGTKESTYLRTPPWACGRGEPGWQHRQRHPPSSSPYSHCVPSSYGYSQPPFLALYGPWSLLSYCWGG